MWSKCCLNKSIKLSNGWISARLVHFSKPDYGVRSVCAWVKHKFDIEIPQDEVRDLEQDVFADLVCERASQAYNDKESEYPIMAGFLPLFKQNN